MKIYAPVANTNGVYASVRFVNGVGETDNPRLIEWFKTHGYRLEKCDEAVEKPLEKCEETIEKLLENCDEPDFDAMTPNELRDWAKANGFGSVIKNTRNKEKLLEIIRG
jgi:hypothetical protein